MTDTSLSLRAANLMAIPLFAVMMACAVAAYALLWGGVPYDGVEAVIDAPWSLIGVATLASIVAHELLHGVAFRVFGHVPWSEIRFGVHWKLLTPYASTTTPMPASSYRIAIVLPGIVLGLLPLMAALLFGLETWFWYGAFMLGTASGDALALWVVRHLPGDTIVADLADRLGCVVVAPAHSD